MLTKLTIRNFKRFDSVEVELGNPVVFIGPNNSGKTTALQALALWEIGLRKWNEKRAGKEAPEKRPDVTINRKDLIAVPVPYANLLWRDLHVRDVQQNGGKPQTKNIRIEIVVDGVTEDKPWSCGLEFNYANEESFYCRPLRASEDKDPERMPCATQDLINPGNPKRHPRKIEKLSASGFSTPLPNIHNWTSFFQLHSRIKWTILARKSRGATNQRVGLTAV